MLPTLSLQTRMLSMEGLELVCLDRGLILVQVGKRILSTIVVRVVVSIDGLSFETSDRIKFFDGGSAQPSECPEHGPLNFCNLGVLHGVDECVLCLCGVVLQLLGGVLFAERRDFVEVHFQIVRHLLCQLILWCLLGRNLQEEMEGLQLVCLNRRLILVQVGKRILSTIVVRVVISIDGLSFKT